MEIVFEIAPVWIERFVVTSVTHGSGKPERYTGTHDDVAYLDNGVLVDQGTPQEIFNNPRHESTRALLERVR